MPEQGRLGDKSQVPSDSHGCPACPHPCIGPAVGGSPDVYVNGKPALRVGDPGVHAACCGPNTWSAKTGAPGVFFNSKKAHRLGDVDTHCGGTGKLIEGSANVIVGNYVSAGPAEKPPPPAPIAKAFQIVDPFGNPMVRTVFDAKIKVNGAERQGVRFFTDIVIGVEEGETAEIELFGPQGE